MNSRQIKRKLIEILGANSRSISVLTINDTALNGVVSKCVVARYQGRDFPSFLRNAVAETMLVVDETLSIESVNTNRIILTMPHWESVFNHEIITSRPPLMTHTTGRALGITEDRMATFGERMRETVLPMPNNDNNVYAEIAPEDFRGGMNVVSPVPPIEPTPTGLGGLFAGLRRGRPAVYAHCKQCNLRLKKAEMIEVYLDGYVCSDCITIFYVECKNCVKYFNLSNEGIQLDDSEENYCNNCKNNVLWHCVSCGEYHSLPEPTIVRGNPYCDSCRRTRTVTCRACGGLEEMNRRSACSTCNDVFCRDCSEDHRDECGYRDLPEKLLFLTGKAELSKLPFGRHVGVEIEAEKGQLARLKEKLPKYVGIAHDGSLHDRGIEIQTPPASYNELEKIVGEVTTALKGNGFKGTINCGLHLHFDARDILTDHTKIVQVIKTFYAMEDLLFSMLPPSRWSPDLDRKNYCQRLSSDYLYDNFRKKSKKSDFEKEWYKVRTVRQINQRKRGKYDASRYYGLNIHSIFYRHTIELRYHSGTVEPTKIINWINITSRMIEYAINNYKQSEVEWFYDTATSYEKFKRFTHLLDLPSGLRDYMSGRVEKFNPQFRVQFNLGKVMREKERRELTSKRKKIATLVKSFYPQALAEVKRDLKNQGDEHQSTRRIRQYAINRAEELAKDVLPKDLFNLPVDGGFVKDKELAMIRFYMDKGRELATALDNGADDPGL